LHLFETSGDNSLLVRQALPSRDVTCGQRRAGINEHLFVPVSDGAELSDCFSDLQVVAVALGVSCPAPPDFLPQP
jgi:hypothetical protein